MTGMIRAAISDDLEQLVEIEREAGRAFADVGMPEIADDDPGSPAELEPFVARGHAWVATDAGRPVAYLIAGVVDDRLHVEQVSVHPSHAGRRLGAALIDHAAAGRAVSLTTFRDVPWNAPYYGRLGFTVIEPADQGLELAALVRREAEAIPGHAPRVAMVRPAGYRARMSKLSISHHERVEGHPHRWHVHLHGRDKPIPVELPPDERQSLEMTDEDIHAYLPSALQKHLEENRDDQLPGEEYHDATWDSPVRIMQTHFMG